MQSVRRRRIDAPARAAAHHLGRRRYACASSSTPARRRGCSSSVRQRRRPASRPGKGSRAREWQRPPGGNQAPVSAQIGNSAGPVAPGGGGRGQRGGPPPSSSLTEGGSLKVVTTGFRAGYLRKNGVPYSEAATITEYFHRLPDAPNGDVWLHVLTIVEDPRYLNERVPHEHALQARSERQQVEPHGVPDGPAAAARRNAPERSAAVAFALISVTTDALFSLQGKTALVTGASYGLGVTFAETLAGAGANLVLAARSLDKVQAVAERLRSAGHKALALKCDVGNPDDVAAMVAAGWQHFGRIDVLVNNAGVAAEATIMPERIPHELFEQTMRVNVFGTWYCCQAIGARQLADGKGGSIVNIASIAGMVGVADFPTAYQTSKAAVINLTRNLAASWADRGIRVNAIAPGWFPSEMTGPVFGIPDYHRWVSEAAPQGRVGEPAELAGPLLLLASNAGSFMTGHVLVVDGGLSATGAGGRMPQSVSDLFAAHAPNGLGTRIDAAE